MRRGVTVTALVAACMLAATACGSGAGGGDDKRGSGDLSGTVTYWDVSNEAEKDTFREIAEDFEKQHPGVEVDYVNVPFGDAHSKFKNAAGSGDPTAAPDVIRTEVAWTADFAHLGYLAPLDGTRAVRDQDDYLPQAWASTRYQGKTYAVPQVIDTLALFYNKRLLKQAGVRVPRSLAELKRSAEAIRDRTDAAPLYLRGDDPYWFLPYLYGEGGDLVDAEAKRVTIDDPAGVRAFQTIKDLVDDEVALTDSTEGWENMRKAFNNGDVAMTVNGPWGIADSLAGAEFRDDPDNLGVAPVPAGSRAQGSPQGGWNIGVFAGSDNLDAAYEFARYLSSPEVQRRTTEELSLLPTRASVYDEPSVRRDAMVRFFRPAVAKAVERPWIPEANSLFEPLRVAVDKVLTSGTSPRQAADEVAAAWRELLEDWK